MNHTYSVRVTREGRWSMIAIPELDELTQSRRVGDAQRMAREVIALRTGQPLNDVAVDVTI